MRSLTRQEDTMVMIAVETAPATIDFETILAATEIVGDDHHDSTPWDDCDGYAHTVEPCSSYNWEYDLKDAQGYCFNDGRRIVIELTNDDWGIYAYQRERGASKQVASEAVAAERRRTLARLVEWRENGWEYWGVRCDFSVLGDHFEASCWGIDDIDYAEKDVRLEIAEEVADQLEKAGFTVTNKPEARPMYSREDKQASLRRNLNTQNWED